MNSFTRWTAATAILGSTIVGSTLITEVRTFALPDDQVVQKLQSVPVFTIADDKGIPLVATNKDQAGNQTSSVAGVFMSKSDAQGFMDRLKKQNPNIAKNVRVTPVSLGEIYKIAQNQTQKDKLTFAFVPKEQQVTSAQSLLRENGQKVEEFNGVPLFVAKAGKEQGYLTIQQGNQQIIPFFFDKEQLEGMVNNFKKQKPELASTVKVQVINLEGFIQALKSKNNPELSQVVLVPSTESLQFLQSLQSTPGNNQPARANNQRQRTTNQNTNKPKRR
ncbi:Tic22 family protein [Merismopedia glauca]|uniref:Tic22 family protein n=1 Tax=Merismopedia glauca CCAP 1448/3 TaxID=1296344 RepID=A0A2T1BXL8_9CYAN|nr:Tic22 family protein [Merismopedia glauca]PSB00759.1 hypothetical protein C7B64_21855 [Merismopedia glauca CCAP 1448/3]